MATGEASGAKADMPNHLIPRRRLTRQRSGHVVSGEHSGSQCAIVETTRFRSRSNSAGLLLSESAIILEPQFGKDLLMLGFGGFIKPACDLDMEIDIEASPTSGGSSWSLSDSQSVAQGRWAKFGWHLEITGTDAAPLIVDAAVMLRLVANHKDSELSFDLFGLSLGAVTYYGDKEQWYSFFQENLRLLYCPETYYLPHTSGWADSFDCDMLAMSAGEPIVVKACNRCARLLPIDIGDERNALSYSNHCVQRAPCTHNAFSRYTILNLDECGPLLSVEPIKSHIEKAPSGEVNLRCHYGFQLECRVCKKFVVNAPLNPMRNATQHREDSLRRRAVEELSGILLGKQWVFTRFRMQTGGEFDVHIWNKFGERCFACGKELKTTSEMAMDHTLPLVYFWPLDEHATCLCKTCNSKKHDRFPYEFYVSEAKLIELSMISGLPRALALKKSKTVNNQVVTELASRVVWFFDSFLGKEDYQKIRFGKRTADLVYASIQRILNECSTGLDLIEEYRSRTGGLPSTVSIIPTLDTDAL